jgi:hypothetical protein
MRSISCIALDHTARKDAKADWDFVSTLKSFLNDLKLVYNAAQVVIAVVG